MAAKKKYPKSFYDDGLGDFLEWIDDEVLVHSERKALSRKKSKSVDDNLSDGSDSIGPKDKKKKTKKQKSKGKDTEAGPKGKKKKSLYGDNDVSELVYKPPKRRKFQLDEDDDGSKEVEKKLDDKVRGLINRLSAQTFGHVVGELEKLFGLHSRADINYCLFNNVDSMILNKLALTKRKLIAELMLCISYLSQKIHANIGASLVHRLIVKFESLYSSEVPDEDKTLDNIILCLVNLYIIGLISAHVIFELTKRICSSNFKPKSVELLLLIIKSCGFQLRKDNPLLMKNLINMAQDASQKLKDNVELETRVEFMMEALAAIKNNNTNKIGNYGCDIDRDTVESILKLSTKRTKLHECLSDASYEEILSSPNFCLLETRVDDGDHQTRPKQTSQGDLNVSKLDDRVSKALGLKKPTEKAILSVLLRASDYIEASNSIIGYGFNHCSDAMLVCLQVAIYEKKFNPFHFNLINNLCKFNRRYKMAAKFSIQDKIRALGGMELERVKIFRELCLELIKSDAVPITILKSIEWADLSQSTREFLTFLLERISDLNDQELKRKIMSKVERKSSFAGAMRTFTNCFLKGCKLFS